MDESRKKRMLIIIVMIVLLAAAVAGALINRKMISDPNYIIKHSATVIKAEKPVSVSYDLGHPIFLFDKRIPVYMFTPDEDGEYVFDITDISTETDDYLVMSVTDRKFSEYINANNIPGEDDVSADDSDDSSQNSVTGETFLQKGHKYYIFIDAASEENLHKGSFSISVNKSPEEIKPEMIQVDQKVRIAVNKGEQTGLIFVPEEAGYYKFKSEIASKNAATGFSAISDVTSNEGENVITVTDGICRLEPDTEYYIQISVEDIKGRSAKVDVWCRRIADAAFDEDGSARLDARAMIDYTADESGRVLIHSESKGDPKVFVYDSENMPLRADDDSGADFGGSDDDFAVMLDCEKGQEYHIYVTGELNECKVFAAPFELPDEENSDGVSDNDANDTQP
ncbi:MAG: hypothetical protein IJH95_07805 [Mogibacterium sp.]|nr:hypothetical protein [Mogibacterium sp.]